ncbi:MAG: hypothetical protein U9N73_09810, partial [Candidatus Auribacterota bacterium]|nr:hypothetical protein [Candidatus Auribacterota bacterium]
MSRKRINSLSLIIPGVLLTAVIFSSAVFPGDRPEEIYREGYLRLKEADRSFYREDYEDALAGYEKLEKVLQGIKEDYPGWSANLIE